VLPHGQKTASFLNARRFTTQKRQNAKEVTMNPNIPVYGLENHMAAYYHLYASPESMRPPAFRTKANMYEHTPGSYAFISEVPNPLEDRGPQTIEEVITRGYFAAPRAPPEIALLSDKEATSRLALEDVVSQIQRRVKIYRQNINEIEHSKCYAINDSFAWEAAHGLPASSDQQYLLGKRLQELYGEGRRERVALWKDVSRLRQTLPENLQQYLSVYRKLKILDDSPGGAT
jgi:hypothetical protein